MIDITSLSSANLFKSRVTFSPDYDFPCYLFAQHLAFIHCKTVTCSFASVIVCFVSLSDDFAKKAVGFVLSLPVSYF